jgi:hypothetical protein
VIETSIFSVNRCLPFLFSDRCPPFRCHLRTFLICVLYTDGFADRRSAAHPPPPPPQKPVDRRRLSSCADRTPYNPPSDKTPRVHRLSITINCSRCALVSVLSACSSSGLSQIVVVADCWGLAAIRGGVPCFQTFQVTCGQSTTRNCSADN